MTTRGSHYFVFKLTVIKLEHLQPKSPNVITLHFTFISDESCKIIHLIKIINYYHYNHYIKSAGLHGFILSLPTTAG